MSTAAVLEPDASEVVREGWKALVDSLGIHKATQFVVLLERGQGDSVQDIAQYWGDSSIEDIHRRVSDWASRKRASS
jgi:hypothetical protein